MRKLQAYSWPGNVRELRNVVERAVALAKGGTITVADLRLDAPEPAAAEMASLLEQRFDAACTQFQRIYFQHLLLCVSGNKTKAAEIADIDRSTIYNHLRKLGLDGGD